MRRLEEKHKRLAEEILKGTPRYKIAEILECSRATMYEWMKDPDWIAYFEHLAREVEVARQQRLLPVNMKVAEAVEVALDNAIGDMQSGDKERISRSPSLHMLVEALKKITDIQRLERGLPTAHTKSEKADEKNREGAGTRLGRLLDQMVENDEGLEDPSETTVAETPPKVVN